MKLRTDSTWVLWHLKHRTEILHESISGKGTKLTSAPPYPGVAKAAGSGDAAAAGAAAEGAGRAGASFLGASVPSLPWPLRKRDSKLSANWVSGWSVRARAMSASSVSMLFGSVTQQSTGQTAAQAS